jgi:uncharacterized protein
MAGNDEVVKAIQAGNEEALRKLLSEDPGLACARDAAGISALMHAIYRRQTTVIKLLRDAGMKVDWFEAAALGDTELLVGLLKENPTLINSYARDGFTALHLAAYFSQAGAARMLLENEANAAAVAQNGTQVMPLHSAASAANLETVRDLLKHGAPVNARQQHGWTALHAAAQNGSVGIVDLLLQNGADAGIKNDEAITALDLARKHEHGEVASRLAKAQAVSGGGRT